MIADLNLSALAAPLTALSNVSFCDALDADAVRRADIVALLVARSRFWKSREKKRCALSSSTSPV